MLSAGKIMVCFGHRRRRKVETGREYRVFGILHWRRSRQPALIARKQLYLLPRFAPTTWSSVAPKLEAKCISLSRQVNQAMDM
jgi:hypothetical protein